MKIIFLKFLYFGPIALISIFKKIFASEYTKPKKTNWKITKGNNFSIEYFKKDY